LTPEALGGILSRIFRPYRLTTLIRSVDFGGSTCCPHLSTFLRTLVAVATCRHWPHPRSRRPDQRRRRLQPLHPGRISGRGSRKGKDPVSFANVVVMGTKLGTMTDETGAFVIGGVPVSTYTVNSGDRLRR
jgi:hypothetical protein